MGVFGEVGGFLLEVVGGGRWWRSLVEVVGGGICSFFFWDN